MNKQSHNSNLIKLISLYNSFYPKGQLRCDKCSGKVYHFDICRCIDTYEIASIDKLFKDNENDDFSNRFLFEQYNSVYLMCNNDISIDQCIQNYQNCRIDENLETSWFFISPCTKVDIDGCHTINSNIAQLQDECLKLFAEVLLLYDINCTHEIETYQCND